MRAEYRNGHEITLIHSGCDGCSPVMVNGIFCHEAGCPDAWRDQMVPCWECGVDFYPEDRPSRYSTCDGCRGELYGDGSNLVWGERS